MPKTVTSRAVHFVVRGSGEFPWDMLRYDNCMFSVVADARHADDHENYLNDSYFYAMVSYQERARWKPTFARWESFGFEVVELAKCGDPLNPITLAPA